MPLGSEIHVFLMPLGSDLHISACEGAGEGAGDSLPHHKNQMEEKRFRLLTPEERLRESDLDKYPFYRKDVEQDNEKNELINKKLN